jgi:uncharacterized protein YaiI (UPF0178 family)
MADTSIIHGEKNRVKRALFEFVKANPDPTLYNIKNVWFVNSGELSEDGKEIWIETVRRPKQELFDEGMVKKSYNPDTDVLEESLFTKNNLTLLIEGRKVSIEFVGDGARIGDSFSSLHVEKAPGFFKWLNSYMAILRKTYTQYSPEFVLRNLMRDMTAGTLNVRNDYGNTVATQVVRNVPRAMKHIRRGFSEKAIKNPSKYDKLFDEYRSAGAMTGYTDIKSVSDHQKNLMNQIDAMKGNTASAVVEKVKSIVKPLDEWNRTFENAMRFSSFMTLREQGKTVDEAAVYAKNLTVNFNKKGRMSNNIGALYLFFNASLQGTARIVSPFTSKDKVVRNRAIATALALPAISMMFALMNRLGAGTDDDDEYYYDKLSEHTRSHNIIFPNGFSDKEGDFVQIPLPYGFNFFWAMGDKTLDALMGKKSITHTVASLASNALGSFSPMGSPDLADKDMEWFEFMGRISPTIFAPIVDTSVNRNFAGFPIYKKPYMSGTTPKPDSEMYFSNVNPALKHMTATINRWTGGDREVSGAIDINPETLEFLAQVYGGGAFSFINNSATTVLMALSGDNPLVYKDNRIKKVPFVRNYINYVSEAHGRYQFFDNMNEVKDDETIYKRYVKANKMKRGAEYKKDNVKSFRMSSYGKATKKKVDKIRDEIQSISNLPPSPARDRRLEGLAARENALYLDFNKRYNNFEKKNTLRASDYIFK